MGEYLARKAYRRIAHVTGPRFFSETVTRAEGFEAALADNDAALDSALRFERTYFAPSGREAVRWLLEQHRGTLPSAIFFANYLMAAGWLSEFHDNGLAVLGDVAVAVFDDLPQLEYVRPRLTQVGNSPAVLACRSALMLIDRLGGQFKGPNWAEPFTLYRWQIEDPVIFQKNIRVTIEHGHANRRSDGLSSMAFWYQAEPHKPFAPLPEMRERLPTFRKPFENWTRRCQAGAAERPIKKGPRSQGSAAHGSLLPILDYMPFSLSTAAAFSLVTFSVGRVIVFSTFLPFRKSTACRKPSAPGVA